MLCLSVFRVSASGCEAEEDVSHNSEESFDPPLPASNHSGNVVNDIGQSCDIAVKPPKWINIAVDASDFSESLDGEDFFWCFAVEDP